MLRSLHIRNYILIDSLDIKFPEGLVIITGQTGAGKSILLGALGLLAGDKAEPSMISDGAENCVVEGEFDTPDGPRIIRRVLYSSGRSRSFIDDCPVQLQELTALCSTLIDIHSQHNSLLLTDKHFQLSLLDRFAGNEALLDGYHKNWRALAECRKELENVLDSLSRSKAERDYNEAQFRELSSAGLQDDELPRLEEEQKALANAEQIRERLDTALCIFRPREQESMSESLRDARKSLDQAGRFLPDLLPLCERLESARIELEDIFAEAEDAAERIDVSGDRLAAVEERLSLLYRLMAKHSCGSIEELIQARERFGSAAASTEELEELRDKLQKRLALLQNALDEYSGKLSSARSKAAPRFAADIEANLKYLELDRASFQVELLPIATGADGSDAVCFKFAADGRNGMDVAKCASGGEISRIMLSLKAMMARFKGMPTLIFDEIDSGVSGSVADKMGSMICRMGETMQVISITHLPQVAAKGSAHFVVEKQFDASSGRSTSGIHQVAGDERVSEIARLLSGASITPEALANARSLLSDT